MVITSINNEKIKYYNKLKLKKFRDEEKLFLVEGEHLVSEALKHKLVKEIITLEDKKYDIPYIVVSENVMKKISNMPSSPKVMALCYMQEEKRITGNVLLLDRIQDPGNLGTIIRSASAFDFNTIIISNDTVDIYNDKVIRSSEGMLFNVNIIRSDLAGQIKALKDNNYFIYGTDVIKGKNIKDINKEKIAIVIGNEGQGISDDIKNICDDFIYINMNNNTESLNAAVASSIIMYEVYNG